MGNFHRQSALIEFFGKIVACLEWIHVEFGLAMIPTFDDILEVGWQDCLKLEVVKDIFFVGPFSWITIDHERLAW